MHEKVREKEELFVVGIFRQFEWGEGLEGS